MKSRKKISGALSTWRFGVSREYRNVKYDVIMLIYSFNHILPSLAMKISIRIVLILASSFGKVIMFVIDCVMVCGRIIYII